MAVVEVGVTAADITAVVGTVGTRMRKGMTEARVGVHPRAREIGAAAERSGVVVAGTASLRRRRARRVKRRATGRKRGMTLNKNKKRRVAVKAGRRKATPRRQGIAMRRPLKK